MPPDPSDRPLSRRLWGLTWPVIVSNALELVVGLIDLWLVRPFGPSATAAYGVGRQLTVLVDALSMGVTAGILTLVSQAVGARARPGSAARPLDVDAVVRQGVALVLLVGLPAGLTGAWLSGLLLAGLQAGAEVRAHGEPYLRVYFLGLVFTWANLVGTALFRGAGDVWTPLKVAVGVSGVQVALNCLLVGGAGPVPTFGVRGAALGAVAARAAGMLVFLALLLHGAGPLRLRRPAGTGLDWSLTGSLLRVGVPVALANMLRHGSRVAFLAVVGASTLGVALQAAVGVGLQVRLLGVLVALAFQTATATLVGQALGRGDVRQAERLGWHSVQLLAALMGVITGLVVVLAWPVAGLFLDAPDAGLGGRVLCWFAVAQFVSALSIGLQGALLGAGDTLPALRYTALSEWCVLLPLSFLLVRLDWVPDGLLAAWVLAPALTLVLMVRRFRSGLWKPRNLATDETRMKHG